MLQMIISLFSELRQVKCSFDFRRIDAKDSKLRENLLDFDEIYKF